MYVTSGACPARPSPRLARSWVARVMPAVRPGPGRVADRPQFSGDAEGRIDGRKGASEGQAYLGYLDGLRAIALLATLVFHLDTAWLPGGFLGVEMFFVISGFIITKQLVDEWAGRNAVDLRRFWHRRFRRLYAALAATLLLTWAVVVWLYPQETSQITRDLPYGFTFTSNLAYILDQQSYFETIGRPRLFQHLWSVGIEFQYYMLWPILCLVLLRSHRWIALLVLTAGALSSTWWMAHLYVPGDDPSRVYFGTDTRVSALLVGSFVAVALPRPTASPSGLKSVATDAAGVAAFVVLFFCLLTMESTNDELFRGGFLCVSLLTAAVIATSFVAVSNARPNALTRMLGSGPLRAIGVRTYALYLCHWPIFCLTQPWVDVPMDGTELVLLRLGLTGVVSEMVYRFIETPVRRGALGRAIAALREANGRRRLKLGFAWSVIACLAFAGCSSLVAATRQEEQNIAEANARAVAEQAATLAAGEPASAPPVTSAEINDAERNELAPPPSPAADAPAGESTTAAGIEEPVAEDQVAASAAAEAEIAELQGEASACVAGRSSAHPYPLNTTRGSNGRGYITRATTVEGERPAVFAIGDSVMLGAANEMLKRIPGLGLDAQVGRQAAAGIGILADRRDGHRLGDTVIVHLGNNGPMNATQIDQLMQVLRDAKDVIFINLKLPRNYEQANNRLIEDAAKRYSNVTVVDWRANSLRAGGIFGGDGIHLTGKGAVLFTRLIEDALCRRQQVPVASIKTAG